MFSASVIEQFTEGECMDLAYQLHLETKWPIAIVYYIDSEDKLCYQSNKSVDYFGHLFCVSPYTPESSAWHDVLAADIMGVRPLKEIRAHWESEHQVWPLTEFHIFPSLDDFLEEMKWWNFNPLNVDAYRYAQKLKLDIELIE